IVSRMKRLCSRFILDTNTCTNIGEALLCAPVGSDRFMGILQFAKYRTVLGVQSFRAFWLGFTFSAIGDAMTNVALVWYVYQTTHAPQAVGLLLLCYTGPVILGGLMAGVLLDRFNRRTVMLADAMIRGSVVATIPILYALGHLALWQLYVVAAVYGLLFMITL